VSTTVTLNFQPFYIQRGKTTGKKAQLKIDSSNNANQDSFYIWDVAKQETKNNIRLYIKNNGPSDVEIPQFGTEGRLEPDQGKEFAISVFGHLDNLSLVLPGNSNQQIVGNAFEFTKANYTIEIRNVEFRNPNNKLEETRFAYGITNTDLNATKEGETYYLRTRINDIKTSLQIENDGDLDCVGRYQFDRDVLVDGLLFPAPSTKGSNWISSSFSTNRITVTLDKNGESCGNIPFQLV
jgi:hypothetical protein